MEGDRTHRAVARIEAALARIEATARHSPVHFGDNDGLATRHAQLRESVAHSIAEIDRLLAGASG